MKLILAIAAGGALGAVGRHLVNMLAVHLMGHGFPYGTLAVNIIGSFAMGALITWFALSWEPPVEIKAFLTVGLLGALTTFSTFSLDFVTLYERGQTGPAFGYVAVSVVLSIGALMGGMHLMRSIAGPAV